MRLCEAVSTGDITFTKYADFMFKYIITES